MACGRGSISSLRGVGEVFTLLRWRITRVVGSSSIKHTRAHWERAGDSQSEPRNSLKSIPPLANYPEVYYQLKQYTFTDALCVPIVHKATIRVDRSFCSTPLRSVRLWSLPQWCPEAS